MERRSFLKAIKADWSTTSTSTSTKHFFHGVDLSAQPFLTKRGRKTNRVVKRVFVILDGYLFYFQSALSSEPCGVVSLEGSEYITHSYASSERLSNFCFELRSPAREWGSVILHFHNFEHSKVHAVEQVLDAAGARSRRPRPTTQEPPTTAAAPAAVNDAHKKSTPRPVLSRLFTLSKRLLGSRPYDAAADDDALGHDNLVLDTGPILKASINVDGDEDTPSSHSHMDDATDLEDEETTTFICKSAKGRHSSLVKLQWRRRSTDDENEGIIDATAAAAATTLNDSHTNHARRKRNTIAFAGTGVKKVSFPLDNGDFVAEQNIQVELCHDLCTNGFVENSGRKMFHFMAPFWPWEKQRHHADQFLLTMEGETLPRIRFATTDESQRDSRAFPTAAEYRGLIEISAVEGKMFASIQMGKERALSFPLLFSNAHSTITLGSPGKQQQPPRLALCGDGDLRDGDLSFEPHTVALRPPSPQQVSHGSVFLGGSTEFHKSTALAMASTAHTSSLALSSPVKSLVAAAVTPSKCLPLLSPTRPMVTVALPPLVQAPVRPMLLALPFTNDVCLALDTTSMTPTKVVASPMKLALSRAGFGPTTKLLAAVALASSPLKSNMVQPPTLARATDATSPLAMANAPVAAVVAPAPPSQFQLPPPPPPPEAAVTSKQPRDVRLIQAVSLAESYSGSCHLKKYEPVKMIGCGGFGHVMVARQKSTGQLVAIKSLSKKAVTAQNQIQHSMSEKAVLTMCRNHPFIIQIHAAFQTIDHLHMVLDYCPGGELFFHLSQAGRFKEHHAAFYTAEVFLALEHLHHHDIIYRDLKPENILLDKHGHVRLADFGLSKCGVDDWSVAMTFCGSIEYLAPEVLALGEPALANALAASSNSAANPIRKGYGKAADFWALGCLLYELLTGEPPFFSGNNRPMLYSRIMKGAVTFPPYISADAKHLIQGLLTLDPADRLGSKKRSHAAIREHPFFTKFIDWDRLLHRNVRPPFQPRQEEFANFDKQFTSMPVGAVDKMAQFPRNLPMDYQLFENYNWEPAATK